MACEQDYLSAKSRITLNMTAEDCLVYLDDPQITPFCRGGTFRTVGIDPKSVPGELSHFNTDGMQVLGHHNLLNFTFVLRVAEILELDPSHFQRLLYDYEGLEHRLEKVPSPIAPLVINDAKSTNFFATASALRSLRDYRGRIALILGGKTRGKGDVPTQEFIDLVGDSCHEVILQGESRDILKQALQGRRIHECRNLEEAVVYLKNSGPHRRRPLLARLCLLRPIPELPQTGGGVQKIGDGRREIVHNNRLPMETPISQNIARLQDFMRSENLDAFYVSGSDVYLNEYVPLEEGHRYPLTGFAGSTGETPGGQRRA